MNQDISGGVATGGTIGGAAGLSRASAPWRYRGCRPHRSRGPHRAAPYRRRDRRHRRRPHRLGIPEESGRKYEEHVKSGKIVAAVKTSDDKVEDAAEVLRRNGAYDVETH
jgi:hypothetical protein